MIIYLILTFLLGFLIPIFVFSKKQIKEDLFAENITLKKFCDYDISIDEIDYSEFNCN